MAKRINTCLLLALRPTLMWAARVRVNNLRGENMDGSLSQLVFYTPRGIERVKDITGKGPDHDRCGTHEHH